MIGGGFQHAFSSCGWDHPEHVVWDKKDHEGSVSIHIDEAIISEKVDPNKTNIAWFAESPFFTKKYMDYFDSHMSDYLYNSYDFIFSCDKEFVEKHPKVMYVPPTARPWVKEKRIFPKTQWASIIASPKREAPGHQLRHEIIAEYKDHLGVFGGGYRPIQDKGEGLNDFCYSFAIENVQADGYFTEKISDCFATGTIPIYWGDRTISRYFVEDGIIWLNDGFDPSLLTKELYDSKAEAIRENFERAINLPLPEDYIYLNYLK